MLLVLKYNFFESVQAFFSLVNRFTRHRDNKILIYDPKNTQQDNSGVLYEYLMENGYNKKYEIVYACDNHKELSKHSPNNVKYIGKSTSAVHFLTAGYVYYRANWMKIKPSKEQQVIQMWHGSPIKKDASDQPARYGVNPFFTGFLSASKNFDPIYSEVFRVPISRMIRCGHPRTDDLFKPSPEYDFGDYEKLIIWTPTYRKRQKQVYAASKQVANDDMLLPIISADKFIDVNDYLRTKGVKVVVKLHPLQSLDLYNLTELDHFILLSHSEFVKRGMKLYRFMKQCDAMITDYSSIYWDYLVLDRPIGFTEDDIEEYANGRGFIMDDPEKFKPGQKIKTLDDFFKFVDDVVSGHDDYRLQRKEMNEYGNPVTDGHSCQRALEAVGITI